MLTVLFFVTAFSSLLWLVYALLYIHGLLAGVDLNSVNAATMAMYAGLTILPVWIVWQVFGFVSQYFRAKGIDARLTQLFNQMKKNQDYTDLVVRVMLDAEHEIKDGFVINKFDVFVADMNEILADIIQRCNVVSSAQAEQLWSRVKNGERWIIAKTLVEAAKSHDDFSLYLAEKARKDSVFKGTLLEFCARYQNLSALLEKHDRDRVFITIIETGVMGKVYSLLAPVVEALDIPPETPEEETVAPAPEYEVSPRIVTMEEPKIEEEKSSFFSKLNPFKRRLAKTSEKEAKEPSSDDNEFFAALQKSMTTPEETHKSYMQAEEYANVKERNEPRFSAPEADEAETEPVLSVNTPAEDVSAMPDIVIDEQSRAVPEVKADNRKEQDFAYPFGGWVDEDNYKK